MKINRWFLLLLVGAGALSQAASRNDIPGCYDFAKLSHYRPADSGRELVIVIDQTVKVPHEIKNASWQQVLRFTKPGDRVVLYQFSALLQNNFMQRMFDGQLDPLLADKNLRDGLGMESLKSLDKCLVQQKIYFGKTIGGLMAKSFAGQGDNIAKSEILDSLKRISDDLAQDKAASRTIFLISDMLENSAFDSFYRNNTMRLLSPEKTLQQLNQQNLLTDFKGARVFIAGAGLIDTDTKNNYRSGKVLQQLEAFWRGYFTASHAELVSFGAPALNVELN
ncbi:hypothetical protein ACTUSZ_16715 [Pantoea eucalypti]|uniref:hypothetical protein n=1 Tax=Pantoea eucalypti TaxID=470933 RepID=UPI003FA49E08